MGDFFEDLGKRITETAEAVSRKTEEVVETQKIKSQIRVMERNNEKDFQDLGKMIYDRFKKGEIVDLKFIEICGTIEQREESIAAYLKEIAELKGKDVCSGCKGELEPGMAYCPSCGRKVEETIVEEAAEEEEVSMEEEIVSESDFEEEAEEAESVQNEEEV